MSAPINMPTPSDHPAPRDWAAPTGAPRQSVFGNYQRSIGGDPKLEAGAPKDDRASQDEAEHGQGVAPASRPAEVQAKIDAAMARSFVYRFLAKAFEDPTEEVWRALTGEDLRKAVAAATVILAANAPALVQPVHHFLRVATPDAFEEHLSSYLACFGHAARGRCPLNEIEYGDIKADPLFQPHRLADLAAFYNAFGLVVGKDAQERHDHLSLECEFMCVLTAKEAYALDRNLDAENLAVCRDAQKKFLREHLGRWAPAFARRLANMAGQNPLGALAAFTGAFVAAECARFGVVPGSEDLLLRPTDLQAESLCGSCGVNPEPVP